MDQVRVGDNVQNSMNSHGDTMNDAADPQDQKRCTKCGKAKPKSEFCRNKRMQDGLQGHCKDCNRQYRSENAEKKRAYARQWRAQNVEKLRAYERKYRAKNADTQRAYHRQYYKQNVDKKRAYALQYRSENAEKLRAYHHQYLNTDHGKLINRASGQRYRARKLNATGTHTAHDIEAVKLAQTDKRGRLICAWCHKPITGEYHVDHWIPLSKGGANDADNLRIMHATCNQSKRDKLPHEAGKLI